MTKKRILMVGPDRKDKGGVATVINQYFEYGLNELINLTFVRTSSSGCMLQKLIIFMVSILKIAFLLPRIDILHVHMASRGSFRRKRIIIKLCKYFYHKPVVVHLHGAEFKEFYSREANDFWKKQIVDVFTKSDCVIVLSEQWKAFIEEIAPEANVKVIYNSVPIAKGKNKYKDHNMLFLGRIGERKGIYDLIDAICEINDPLIHVYVGGDGDLKKANQRATVKHVEDQIHFCGWIDNNGKEKLFEKCSTFLLPSYNEGLPMAMLEAMSHGLAIIASDVGGIPSVIKNMENGIIVKPGDIEGLKTAIVEIDKDNSLKQKLGMSARVSIINKYSIDAHIKQLMNVYDGVLMVW